MATRSTKTQTAQAIPEAPAAETEFSTAEMLRSMAAMTGIEIPTGRQLLVGAALSIVMGVAGGYVAAQLATYVMAGAILFTGSAFLALLAMVLTYVIGVYLTWRVTARTVSWVMSGSIEADAAAAKNWIGDKFSSVKARLTPVKVAA